MPNQSVIQSDLRKCKMYLCYQQDGTFCLKPGLRFWS